MDENPCTEVVDESEKNLVPLYGGLALVAMIEGDEERAREWLLKVPRSERGRVKIACDDLDMTLSRLGRDKT